MFEDVAVRNSKLAKDISQMGLSDFININIDLISWIGWILITKIKPLYSHCNLPYNSY